MGFLRCLTEVRPDLAQMPEIFVFFILPYDTEPLPGGFLKDSVKNRVEGSEYDIRSVYPGAAVKIKRQKSVSHLLCRCPGEGHDKDGRGVCAAGIDQMPDSLSQDEGLAAAGAGNHGTGTSSVADGSLLDQVSIDCAGRDGKDLFS